METDLKRIRLLSSKKEDENWEFRSYLKCSVSSAKVDRLVNELSKEVSAQINCRTCANCCRSLTITVTKRDITRLAKALKLKTEEVINKYLAPAPKEDEPNYVMATKPCPFLKENDCSIYENRPDVCRSYPHLHKKGFVHKLIGIISNCDGCPIVFNVYEELKKRLHWRDK